MKRLLSLVIFLSLFDGAAFAIELKKGGGSSSGGGTAPGNPVCCTNDFRAMQLDTEMRMRLDAIQQHLSGIAQEKAAIKQLQIQKRALGVDNSQ